LPLNVAINFETRVLSQTSIPIDIVVFSAFSACRPFAPHRRAYCVFENIGTVVYEISVKIRQAENLHRTSPKFCGGSTEVHFKSLCRQENLTAYR